MTVPNQLGFGKSGWHGQESVSLRTSIRNAPAILAEFVTPFNNVLGTLDSDSVVVDSNYDSLEIDTALASALTGDFNLEHLAQGGSYAHGDDAVRLRSRLEDVSTLANEAKTQFNALLVKLDADTGVAADDYEETLAVPSDDVAISLHFANGAGSTHGDAGVALRIALENMVAISNQLKDSWNAMLAKLDADGLNYNSYVSVYSIILDDA